LSFCKALASFHVLITASQRLHDQMTSSVLLAKIEFFDTNPIGRILNRFSADVGSNDDILPLTMYDFVICSFLVLGGIITAAAVLPIILVIFPFLLWYFFHLRNIFVATTRELKRLEGLARSPIFAMISESLSGIATIRTNDSIDFFRHKFENAQDTHSKAFFAFIAVSRWLGFRMDFITVVMLGFASFLSVVVQQHGWLQINPTLLGLALMLMIQLAGLFQWTIRQSAEVVNHMVSVERVSAYGSISSEASLTTALDSKRTKWPKNGTIHIHNLSVRYRPELPLSITSLSCIIQSGHRIGVVGRTGSGKSTFVQSLFRLLEAETGSITIDGTDISLLGLHKLRLNMSVIPQVPVLFSGCSIKENLDPFNSFTEDSIWNALTQVQMSNTVQQLPQKLHSLVAEGGSNFSVGQRQLFCLARAILRKSKILVLDEPTANVDKKTDSFIQQTIATTFTNSTLIAVAHRLDTIIDYDCVLVLANGKLVDYGSPSSLLTDKSSLFSSMVDDTGKITSRELRKKAFLAKH